MLNVSILKSLLFIGIPPSIRQVEKKEKEQQLKIFANSYVC